MTTPQTDRNSTVLSGMADYLEAVGLSDGAQHIRALLVEVKELQADNERLTSSRDRWQERADELQRIITEAKHELGLHALGQPLRANIDRILNGGTP